MLTEPLEVSQAQIESFNFSIDVSRSILGSYRPVQAYTKGEMLQLTRFASFPLPLPFGEIFLYVLLLVVIIVCPLFLIISLSFCIWISAREDAKLEADEGKGNQETHVLLHEVEVVIEGAAELTQEANDAFECKINGDEVSLIVDGQGILLAAAYQGHKRISVK